MTLFPDGTAQQASLRVGAEERRGGANRREGYLWRPEGELLERRRLPAITTFDSSAAPEHGGVNTVLECGAAVDLDAVRATFAEPEEQPVKTAPHHDRARAEGG